MRADRVDVSWDAGKRKWMVRIEVGSEVIRRYCDQSHDAGENQLRAAAEQTVADEGYQIDGSKIFVSRE
jgi:alkylation response protein AidB-like acyl-CoA dehydrogenase